MRFLAAVLALHVSAALAGEVWVPLTPPEAQAGTSVLTADPFAPETLYANAYSSNSVVKSTDGGATWNAVLRYSPSELVGNIVVERSGANRVTVLTTDLLEVNVYRAADGGAVWSRYHVSLPVTGIPWDMAIDPLDSNTLYIAHAKSCYIDCIAESGGISKSTDGGRTWTAIVKGRFVEQILIDPFGSGTIYAGVGFSGATGWRRSTDGGATWSFLPQPGTDSIFRIAFDPLLPGVLYAGTSEGNLWRSDDRGNTWHLLGKPFISPLAFPWTIAVDPTQRQTIVVGGGSFDGASRSSDGGRTWSPLNNGLTGFAIAPSQLAYFRTVFFTTNGRLYGASDLGGALMLVESRPRRRPARH